MLKICTQAVMPIQNTKSNFETVKPKSGIIPIHTEAPEKFEELFHQQASIIFLRDGEVFDVK